jgi:SAM-dependent methyltransferase
MADFYHAAGVVAGWGPLSKRSAALVDRIVGECRGIVRAGSVCLDLGCGTGRYTFMLEKLGGRTVGVDYVRRSLVHARSVAAETGSGARFVCADVRELPFVSGSIDVILLAASNIVEHSYDDFDQIAAEARRILAVGGVFAVSMHDCLRRSSLMDDVARIEPTGEIRRTAEVPGYGQFDCPSWFWTPGFAAHVLRRRFHHTTVRATASGHFWLEARGPSAP